MTNTESLCLGMRRIFVVAALMVSSIVYAAKAPTSWTAAFVPSAKDNEAACSDAFRIEAMPRSTELERKAYDTARANALLGRQVTIFDPKFAQADLMTRISNALYFIELQLPVGSTYNVCKTTLGNLEAQPKNYPTPATLLYVEGQAPSLADAEKYNAVLTLLDASGNELARLQPSKASKGLVADWKPKCRTSNSCTWTGMNTYFFRFSQDQQALLGKTTMVRILVNRGQGIESRDVKVADFNDSISPIGYLSAPRPAQAVPGVKYIPVGTLAAFGSLDILADNYVIHAVGGNVTLTFNSALTGEGFSLGTKTFSDGGTLMVPISVLERFKCQNTFEAEMLTATCAAGAKLYVETKSWK